jgi:hypothetical protein
VTGSREYGGTDPTPESRRADPPASNASHLTDKEHLRSLDIGLSARIDWRDFTGKKQMFRAIIANRIPASEKDLGVSLDYLHHILLVSPLAFFKFYKIMSIAGYRKRLPQVSYHVVRCAPIRS